ncbi:MAG: phage BR0599 family protein [Verrucomicrobiota bacterium]
MKAIEYNTEALFLLDDEPDWGGGFSAEFEMLGRVDKSASAEESRHLRDPHLRVTQLRYQTLMDRFEAIALVEALRRKTIERVAVPYWAAARQTANYASAFITGGLNVSYRLNDDGQADFSEYEIHQGLAPASLTVTDSTMTAPLLLGYLQDDLNDQIHHGNLLELELDFHEAADASHGLVLAAHAFLDGATPTDSPPDSAPKIFPLSPDYAQPIRGGMTRRILDHEYFGAQRRPLTTYHGAQPEQTFAYVYTMDSDEAIARVIRFFFDHGGATKPFWLGEELMAARLDNDHNGGSVLALSDITGIAVNDYLGLFGQDGKAVVGQVNSVSGNNVSGTFFGPTFSAGETLVARARLCRFERSRIRIDYEHSHLATAHVPFVEVRAELLPNLMRAEGVQSARASLYTLTWHRRPGADFGSGLEIAFLLDATLFNSQFAPILEVFDSLGETLNHFGNIRWAFIAFRAGQSPTTVTDFTDYATFRAAVDAYSVANTNAGDQPGYEAVKHAIDTLSWGQSPDYGREVLLYSDADSTETGATQAEALTALQALGARFHYGLNPPIGISLSGYEALRVASEGFAIRAGSVATTLREALIDGIPGVRWRYTSFPTPVSLVETSDEVSFPIASARTFTNLAISHGKIKKTVTLSDSCTINAPVDMTGPFWKMAMREIGTLVVKIQLVEVTAGQASAPQTVFVGNVLDAPLDGPVFKVDCGPHPALTRTLPVRRFSTICEVPLFSEPCTLLRKDWTFTARWANVGGQGLPYTFTIDSITRDNGEALPHEYSNQNDFAWGYIIDAHGQRILINANTVLTNGAMTLTLQAEPDIFPQVGETLRLVPHCDGRQVTCSMKFAQVEGDGGNRLNYQGFKVADENLSLIRYATDNPSGGKK